jgi:hypothetical protein
MYRPLFAPVMTMILPSSCTVLTGAASNDDAIVLWICELILFAKRLRVIFQSRDLQVA